MLKRASLVLWGFVLMVSAGSDVFGQDTTTIQTFTWDSPTRSQVFDFDIDTNKEYRQILMSYNIRCHDNRVGNGSVGCREWDYSCNTFVTDSTRTDSLSQKHPNYLISGHSGDRFAYRTEPAYRFLRYERIKTRGGSGTDLDTFVVLSGQDRVEGWQSDQMRYQFILTKEELLAAGMVEGSIRGLEIPFEMGDFMSMTFKVKMKHTSQSLLSTTEPDLTGFVEVYFDQLEVNQPGFHPLLFSEDFDWNGEDNVLIEFSYDDKITPTPDQVLGTVGATSLINHRRDHVFVLNENQYIEVTPNDVDELKNELTFMGWIYGDPAQLPRNTYLIEAVDDQGRRQLNVHLPWSDGHLYFDCGNDGSGYDRIDKSMTLPEMAGQWNHWAFVKNATTGQMRIYLNGNLWHEGTGKTRPMDIAKMYIGRGINATAGYHGSINEWSIWKKELTEDEIRQAMRSGIDDTYPSFKSLLVYLQFEEERGSEVRNAQNNQYYDIKGVGFWKKQRADELYINFSETSGRPAIHLLQGDLDRENEINYFKDSIIAPMTWVRPFEVKDKVLNEKPSIFYWEAGYYGVYDEHGIKVDSVYFEPEGQLAIEDLQYFEYRPAKFELLSLVTPYGNGLSLGIEGKTFTFDVSDFEPILRGKKRVSVEMGGEWQEEMDIRFHFIEGKSARKVLDIQNVWPFGRGGYGAIQNDDVFEPRRMSLHPQGQEYKVRSSITGHGQNGEFQPREHYINVNGGDQDFKFDVWKECSTIPIYPQGGTWPFDRAGWCPGDPSLLFEHDLTGMGQPGDSILLDYGVNGAYMDQANYLVSTQLVSYGPKKFSNNATLVDIVRPSDKVEWERENPSCNRPTVVISNSGSEVLQFATLEYGVSGGVKEQYNWAGHLDFGESETVELPIRMSTFWAEVVAGRSDVFEAEIISVNRVMDENPEDNVMTSKIDQAKVLSGELQFEIVTNSRGSETSYRILDTQGDVVYEGSGFGPNEKHTVDLVLSPGCYSLEVDDSGDDGLYYWYWEQVGPSRGRGAVRFNKKFRDRYIAFQNFEAEFGRYIHFDFVIDGLVDNKDQRVLEHLNVYPNPNHGTYTLDFYSEEGKDLSMEIFDPAGRLIDTRDYTVAAGQRLKSQMDIKGDRSGMHLVRFTQADRSVVHRVMVFR